MTRSQFAFTVGADEKWVENAGRLLRKRLRFTPAESLWLGLIRVFNQQIGLSLARSSELANEALATDTRSHHMLLGKSERDVARISVDIARYRSSHTVSLSAALVLGGAKRRGRPRPSPARGARAALASAAKYGVDLNLLREGLGIPIGERLRLADENAAFIRAIQPQNRAR